MPPRPGSAIAGRPAENGHGPPPKVFTAPGLVSMVSYANMPPIVPQPVQSAQKTATDFCAKIIPRPPKGGPWEGISAY